MFVYIYIYVCIYIYIYHDGFGPTIHVVEPSRNEWLNCDIVIRRPDHNNFGAISGGNSSR